jgi:dolichol-phosphate mannosyltransferase
MALTEKAAQLLPTPKGPLVIPEDGGEKLRLSIVIPTYNESKNVGELVARLTELLEEPLEGSYELIVVDDDSPDRTWELALGLTRQFPRLRVIRRVGERGLSTAVIRGWQAARGEVLGVIDADLQHPPEVTVQLFTEIERGAALAVGSRNVDGGGVSNWSVVRRFLSRGAQLLGLLILPGVLGRVSDPMSGYFMLRRSAISNVELSPLGYKILIEVIARGRAQQVSEVGYVFRERVAGESKVSWRLYLEYLRHLVRLRLSTLAQTRFLRFALVGLSGVLVDMGLLFLLSDPATLAWGVTRSKAIAAEAAILNNFWWNDAWTFGDLVQAQRGPVHKLRRLVKFNVVCLIGLALNVALLNLQFNYLHMNRYLANAVAILVVTVWNFWVNLKLSFAPAKHEHVARSGSEGEPRRASSLDQRG